MAPWPSMRARGGAGRAKAEVRPCGATLHLPPMAARSQACLPASSDAPPPPSPPLPLCGGEGFHFNSGIVSLYFQLCPWPQLGRAVARHAGPHCDHWRKRKKRKRKEGPHHALLSTSGAGPAECQAKHMAAPSSPRTQHPASSSRGAGASSIHSCAQHHRRCLPGRAAHTSAALEQAEQQEAEHQPPPGALNFPAARNHEQAGGWPHAVAAQVPAPLLISCICSQSKLHFNPFWRRFFSPCYQMLLFFCGVAAWEQGLSTCLHQLCSDTCRHEPRASPCSAPACGEQR